MPKYNIFDPSQYQDSEQISEPTDQTNTGVTWKTNTVIVDGTTLTVMFPEEKSK